MIISTTKSRVSLKHFATEVLAYNILTCRDVVAVAVWNTEGLISYPISSFSYPFLYFILFSLAPRFLPHFPSLNSCPFSLSYLFLPSFILYLYLALLSSPGLNPWEQSWNYKRTKVHLGNFQTLKSTLWCTRFNACKHVIWCQSRTFERSRFQVAFKLSQRFS